MANWTAQDIPDQTGKTVVITGANVGLGLESAMRLAERGARVVLACRNPAKADPALAKVRGVATGPAPSLVMMDLADLASVEGAAQDIAGQVERIDVLMNNAGVMDIPSRTLTRQGFEMQFGVNHLAHFALTLRLLPQLLAAPAARVVALGSIAHLQGRIDFDDLNAERRYSGRTVYSQSKLADVMFGLELDRRSKTAGLPLIGVVAHPGVSKTNLFSAGPQSGGFNPIGTATGLAVKLIGQSVAAGALGQLRAATDPAVTGGEYLGPTSFAGWRGPPRHAPVSKRAMDDDASARLWDASEALVGLTFDDALASARA